MTQIFIGFKPGVGPVLKCLKYDTDDALTVANTAFDRYFYNSENSNLSYVFPTNPFFYRSAELSTLPASFNITNDRGNVVISGSNIGSTGDAFFNVNTFYRITNAYPNMGYVPMSEFRQVDLLTNRVECGAFQSYYALVGSTNHNVVTARQFYTVMGRLVGTTSDATTFRTVYNGIISSSQSGFVGMGEWFVWKQQLIYNDNRNPNAIYPSVWDLPADASTMRTYNSAPNLLSLEANSSRFILSRPGYDVNTTNEFGTIISSNNRSPALCVMNGTENNIPANGSRTIAAPAGVILSQRAVVDVMFRVSGQTWRVPGLLTDTTAAGTWQLSYTVSGNSITFYNSEKDAVDLRYVVFNVDDQPKSTGGNQVMFRGNDGTQDYVQIKKPGTSDPASRPNDILFDSRYPQFQIIAQDFIPISAFGNSSAGDAVYKGARTYRLNFNNAGFVPYLKYSIVFDNCVTTPIYRAERGVDVSNISMLAEVNDNYVDFFCSPDSGWSDAFSQAGDWTRLDYGARIKGVRYYIFGITRK
ncbi:hypothetical protein ECB98_15065 [Brucellaceae bacterium VT-16-1752]|nr:hypothetical protein ECB98_15065 [Brucellaceae bacterium VT-16-1752]